MASRTLWLALSCATVFAARDASAGGPPRAVRVHFSGPSECPDAKTFASDVAGQGLSIVDSDAGQADWRVNIERTSGGFRGALGSTQSKQPRIIEAPSCGDVARGLQLFLLLAEGVDASDQAPPAKDTSAETAAPFPQPDETPKPLPTLARRRVQIGALGGMAFTTVPQPHWAYGLEAYVFVAPMAAIGVSAELRDQAYRTDPADQFAQHWNEYKTTEAAWDLMVDVEIDPLRAKKTAPEGGSSADLFFRPSVGAISTRPVSLRDPSVRAFEYKPKLALGATIGARIYMFKFAALTIEGRWLVYNEVLESPVIADNAADRASPTTWYGPSTLRNEFGPRAGVSLMLPGFD